MFSLVSAKLKWMSHSLCMHRSHIHSSSSSSPMVTSLLLP